MAKTFIADKETLDKVYDSVEDIKSTSQLKSHIFAETFTITKVNDAISKIIEDEKLEKVLSISGKGRVLFILPQGNGGIGGQIKIYCDNERKLASRIKYFSGTTSSPGGQFISGDANIHNALLSTCAPSNSYTSLWLNDYTSRQFEYVNRCSNLRIVSASCDKFIDDDKSIYCPNMVFSESLDIYACINGGGSGTFLIMYELFD